MSTNNIFRILIVEDNETDRQILTKILTSMNSRFEVSEAATIQEAEHIINESLPDLILLDIYLPDQNGFTLLERIQQNGVGKIPVLLVSSFENEEDKNKGFELGALDFINKPINPDDVKARVSSQIRFKKLLDDQKWVAEKTNEGIKMLYKELEIKNEKLKEIDLLKDEFVGNVSHELRTPLTIIRESISQITDGLFGEVPEKQQKYLDKSLVNIDRLRNIIDNLLDISKIEKGKLELFKEKVDIKKLVEEVLSNFAMQVAARNLELRSELPNTDVYALVDSEKMIQVLNNLIGNALKFTDQGFIKVKVIEKDDSIECQVSDSGKGVAQKDLPKLFSKFEQVGRQHGPGEKGTGLGLSIAKGIVELHGGKIDFESEEGKGSTFTFNFPKYVLKEGLYDKLQDALLKSIKQFNQISIIKLVGESADSSNKLFTIANQILHRKFDQIIQEKKSIYILLPDTERDMCQSIMKRINDSVKEKNLEFGLNYHIVNYPMDGLTADELITKIEQSKEAIS